MQVCSFSLLPICGQECLVTVDVHIQDDQNIILLLVQEMQHMERNRDVEPQLITSAITAFQANNLRWGQLGQEPFTHNLKLMPGLMLTGSSPIAVVWSHTCWLGIGKWCKRGILRLLRMSSSEGQELREQETVTIQEHQAGA